ncbi:MAG: hypothetical protein D6B26_01325, partial [Spirochaetaceae bacterium]
STHTSGTTNPYYLKMARIDPLRVQYSNLDWVRALLRWDERNQAYGKTDAKTAVIQGSSDRVLDWEYNMEYLQARFTNANWYLISEAHHNLHHETGENLELLLFIIDNEIKSIIKND